MRFLTSKAWFQGNFIYKVIKMLNFYDFEVFEYDWLVVIINPVDKTETVVVNDPNKLQEYYDDHKREIWVGYNSKHYDSYILKGILCGFNPKEISDYIIVEGKPGWRFSNAFRKVPLNDFDTMLKNDRGLKSLECFMGNDIEETSVPFDIDRELTDNELRETIKYCRHDVEQTIEVFLKRKAEFDASMGLIKIFKLPLSKISRTKAQLVSDICGGIGHKFDDEFEFDFVTCLSKIKKYRHVVEWYKNPENHDYKKELALDIAGVPHVFAWGGIHGAIPKYVGEGIYLNADVTAYYPSTQLRYRFGYRNMSKPENFELIHSENLRLKAIDKKARLPYKIADNSISGQLKDKHSKLYDPRMNNAVCINGQLMLLLLIEMVEPHAQLIQSNTDGILLKLNSIEDYERIDDIVYEWERMTGMKMEFDLFQRVFQKDVNNYVIVDSKGEYKSKGTYVKELSDLDYDLAIVNRALINYMVRGISVEQTVRECNSLRDFQKLVKVSGKYKGAWHNGSHLKNKCFRVFASVDAHDTYIGKYKTEGATIEKFANTPDHCFINNGDIRDSGVPPKLDRQWYIDLANKRLKQFGVI